MPGRVGNNARPVAARLELWLGCTRLEYPRLGLVEVLDFDVEVGLRGGTPNLTHIEGP